MRSMTGLGRWLAAVLATATFASAASGAQGATITTDGCQWSEFTRLPGASTYPDTNTQIFQCVYSAGSTHHTVISGRPPAARFWSFALIDQARREIDNISDDDVQLDADGRYEIAIRVECGAAPNCLETKGSPAPLAPERIYHRIYVPDGDEFGGVPLPEVRYVADSPFGVSSSLPFGSGTLAEQSAELTRPLVAGGEGYEALAASTGLEPSVGPDATGDDPEPARFQGTGYKQLDSLEKSGVPPELVALARAGLGQGGFGATADNAYLTMPYDPRLGNVELTSRGPRYRRQHETAANDLGATGDQVQVRYWSLCTTQATRPVDCLRDENVVVDEDGDFTVVIAPTCPTAGYANCLRSGALGVAGGASAGPLLLLYRNTLAAPAFSNDAGPKVCPEGTTMFCGDYALEARYVARP